MPPNCYSSRKVKSGKFTLRSFKKRYLIKYFSSFFLRHLWDISYDTAKELVE